MLETVLIAWSQEKIAVISKFVEDLKNMNYNLGSIYDTSSFCNVHKYLLFSAKGALLEYESCRFSSVKEVWNLKLVVTQLRNQPAFLFTARRV